MLEHHYADYRRIRKLEADFEQVVRIDAKQDEGRGSYRIDDKTFTLQQIPDNHKRYHQRGAQDGRRKTSNKGVKPHQGE